MRVCIITIMLLAGLGLANCALGQSWKQLPSDDLLRLAREEAYQGMWSSAKEKIQHLLSDTDDNDVILLYGLVLSWEGNMREAEHVLTNLLLSDPANVDAALALCNVYVWQSDPVAALRIADQALGRRPRHSEVMCAKARILTNLERFDEAYDLVVMVLADSASHPAALALRRTLQEKNRRVAIGLTYQTDFFNRFYQPARLIAGQMSYQRKAGTLIARVNHIDRFNLSGFQLEADLYPRISNRFYAYLNYGHSASVLFPENRFGAELFANLPRAFEISFGSRFLIFANDQSVNVYTATVGKYYQRFFLNLRGFLSEHRDAPLTFSGSLLAKYFVGENRDFVSITTTTGFSPDNLAVQNGISLTGRSASLLNYHAGAIGYQRTFRSVWVVNITAESSRQSSFFGEDGHLWMTSLRAAVHRKF